MSEAADGADADALPSTLGACEFSRETTFEVLGNRRRRYVIHYLKHNGDEPVSLSDLAEHVAAWEYDKPVAQLTHRERKRVRNALRQFHLGKMAEHGFVEFDRDRGTVQLTDAASSTDFYVDSLTGGNVPWSTYYLGFAALGALAAVAVWQGLAGLDAGPWDLVVFLVVGLTVSAVAHCYDTYYRMRLGAGEKPREVRDG
jgi:hypothetical protein